MQKLISLIVITLACGACSSKELEKIVTPPDAISNLSSSQGITDPAVTSSSTNDAMEMSSSQAFSSAAASSLANTPTDSSSSNSVEYTTSSETVANSSINSGASSSEASSEPVSATPNGEQLFIQQCASCHDLESNLPFQIGANLSFTELHETISNTMPFNSSNHCTGECAMELAYYIENARL